MDIDPEYKKKLDEQKRQREMILKAKEEKRRATAAAAANSGQKQRLIIVNKSDLVKSDQKRLLLQNLSLNTTEKTLIKMCSDLNVKDKVSYQIIRYQ
jgi:hypothetical protein